MRSDSNGGMDHVFHPGVGLLTKLGSIAVHADEYLATRHHADESALNSLLADPDVNRWLDGMAKLALVPVKR